MSGKSSSVAERLAVGAVMGSKVSSQSASLSVSGLASESVAGSASASS